LEAESNWRGLLATQAFPCAASLGSEPAGRRCRNNLRGQWMRWHVCYVCFRLSRVCVRCRRRVLFWGQSGNKQSAKRPGNIWTAVFISCNVLFPLFYKRLSKFNKLCETDVVIRMGTQTEQNNTTFLQYVVWTIMLPNDSDGGPCDGM
jgi:hypothetical protein